MRCSHLVVAIAAALSGAAARAESWEARPGGADRMVVHVFKKGIFSAFAHNHHFEVTQWHATAEVPDGEPASASVHVVVSADSLRDRQKRLSEQDRRKVDGQAAGPDVLDAQHHPRIEFRSQRFDGERGGSAEHVRGTMHGVLTVRGRGVPADMAVEADRRGDEWRVRGKTRVKQTAMGIKPFSGFGGTVGVKDEIEIELTLTLRQRERDRAR